MSVRQSIVSILRTVPNRERVSKATGIDAATLARLVKGERLPSGDAIDKLADYFGVELDIRRVRRGKRTATVAEKVDTNEGRGDAG